MAQNPPDGYPRITPYLLYEDVVGALEWLTNAFGFHERMRITEPKGKVSHAEMDLAGGVIMMGAPGGSFESPKRHGKVSVLVSVYVDDVDQHFAQAKGAGAEIISEPEDKFYGDRSYMAADLEGHQWSFAQHVRDVSPEEMQEQAHDSD
jgi:PhnB protein